MPDQYDSMAELAEDYKEHIASVYFSAPGQESARSRIELSDEEGMLEELSYIRNELGIPLVLLYNANCYAEHAVSDEFALKIAHSVDKMISSVGITEVTTTSPFVAKVVKKHFPNLLVWASVNMWIGTTQAMKYLGDDFDGYYMQREHNRNFERIRQLSDWCKANQKQLKLLANSGCIYTCPFHTFHDNLVAHEQGASRQVSTLSPYPSPCWDMMYGQEEEKAAAIFLQGSWIRPEDMCYYEPYFSEVKLATRMHSNPRRVLSAYVRGRFTGNMLDLTEPSYARRFENHILDATKFPEDWYERTTACSRNCESCGYCGKAAQKMLVSKLELEKLYMSGL